MLGAHPEKDQEPTDSTDLRSSQAHSRFSPLGPPLSSRPQQPSRLLQVLLQIKPDTWKVNIVMSFGRGQGSKTKNGFGSLMCFVR